MPVPPPKILPRRKAPLLSMPEQHTMPSYTAGGHAGDPRHDPERGKSASGSDGSAKDGVVTRRAGKRREWDGSPTIGLFNNHRDTFSSRYHLTRRGKVKRLGQIMRIANQFDVVRGLTPVKMRLMLEHWAHIRQGRADTVHAVGDSAAVVLRRAREAARRCRPDAVSDRRRHVDAGIWPPHRRGVRPHRSDAARFRIPRASASRHAGHRRRRRVKVQRPGVREIMALDVSIMRSIARTATKMLPSAQVVDLGGVVEELWDTFESETDFLVEARNLSEFKRFCEAYRYMDCPKPYMDLCTEHVVVMDYVEGIAVSHTDQLIEAGYDLKEIGTKLVDNYATQVLDDGFFHADPHPGNIIISGGQIVLIDLGMTGRLNSQARSVLREMIFAVAKQDSAALADGLLRFAGTESNPEDYPALLADLDMVVKEFGTVDLGDLDIAAFLTSLTSLAQRHGIEVPGTVTTVGRALVTLEGLLDEFIPDVNMIQIISDHIAGSKSLDRAAKDEIKALGVEGHQALHGLLSAASESRVAMRMLTRGQLRMNMEVVGSEEPMRLLSDMVNRLTMALIVVGLFVGSSIVYYAGMKPIIFGIPVVGFMGYVIAFILSAWIVFDIYFKGRRSKRR